MPHAIIEYSENLSGEFQAQDFTRMAFDALLSTGLCEASHIKTRAYPAQDFYVETKGHEGRFVHTIIYLLEGRTLEQKQLFSQTMIDKFGVTLKNVDSITVDVREMVKDTYRKVST